MPKASEVPRLVDTHLHTPYAYPALRDKLEESARRIVFDYLRDNKDLFDKIEFSEKGIEINLGDGVTVTAESTSFVESIRARPPSSTSNRTTAPSAKMSLKRRASRSHSRSSR